MKLASIVPNSLNIVAQTAPPSTVTIAKGYNREFILARFGIGFVTAGTPQLGGQAPDMSEAGQNFDRRLDCWVWHESTLQTAGVGENLAGSLAISGFSESGLTEYIWVWLTVDDVDQDADGVREWGSSVTSSGEWYPPSNINTEINNFSIKGLDRVLFFVATSPADVEIASADDMVQLAALDEASYGASVWETVQSRRGQWKLEAESGEVWTRGVVKLFLLGPGPLAGDLPTKAVQTRSIDAKTIADRYNLGQPRQEDYIFTNRKFYQRDDN